MVMVKLSYDSGLLAVIDTGHVVGFCAAVMAPILGSPKALGATELAWYVSPESRGGRYGIKLMQFMEEIAKEAGVKYFTMVSMHSSMEVGSIYERMGYTKTETAYTKVI
jgi:ribosomal protein S18 acetylase RimI-like enzyme